MSEVPFWTDMAELGRSFVGGVDSEDMVETPEVIPGRAGAGAAGEVC